MNQKFNFLKFKNDFENLFIFRKRNSSEISALRKHLIQFIKKLKSDFNYFSSSKKILIINFDIHQIEIELNQAWNTEFENQSKIKFEIESIKFDIDIMTISIEKIILRSSFKERKNDLSIRKRSLKSRFQYRKNQISVSESYKETKQESKSNENKKYQFEKKKQIQKSRRTKLKQIKKSKQNWIFSNIQFYWISS